MLSMCFVPPPPPQQKENKEFSERLSVLEKTLTLERERQSREIESLRRSEEETRAKAETVPSLLEQLSFLQQKLETTCREKDELEEQTRIYKEQTQQVGQFQDLKALHTFSLKCKCFLKHLCFKKE